MEEWPAVPQIKAKPSLTEPGFKEAFRNALECASEDASRLILDGACLDARQPDCHCVVASDGRHLFAANTFHFSFTEPVVVPARKFLAWSGFTEDGDWLLAVEEPTKEKNAAYVQIQSDRWTFLTRCIEGSYPNWRQVMPADDREATTVTLNQDAVDLLLDVLPRMPFTDNSDQPISLVLRNRKLILCCHSPASGEAEIPVPGALVDDLDRHVCLSRRYITKALRFGFSEFSMQGALSPVLFTGPGKKLVVMPINMGGPAPVAAEQPESPEPVSQPASTPAETAEPVPPSAGQPSNPTEQNTPMATASNIAVMPASERGNIKPTNGNGNANGDAATALKAVVDHIERIKTNLRDVISDLNDTLDLLKAAEKEKKATLKEVESIRATLRSLQKVEL